MPSPTVYLVSRSEEENHFLSRKLDPLNQEFANLRFVSLHTQGLRSSARDPISTVVMNFQDWTQTEAGHLEDLREGGYEGPVLVIARANTSAALKMLKETDDVVFLEKPFEPKDLTGIVRKMLTIRAVAQRVHRRYNTSQSAELEFYGRNDSFASKVANLSKGGAYLELASGPNFRVGDMIRVKLELQEVNRVYSMPAKVVWTRRFTGNSGTGVGVEFIGPAEVKKTILGGP